MYSIDVFENQLTIATNDLLLFNKQFVKDKIDNPIKYVIMSNLSVHFPWLELYVNSEDEMSSVVLSELKYLDFYSAVKVLYVDGRVPEWIRMSIIYVSYGVTYVLLHASSLLVSNPNELWFRDRGYPPFQCMSPSLPVGQAEINGGFWLAESISNITPETRLIEVSYSH